MTGKMKLYIGLLVLGLVLLGGGLWFLFNPVPVIEIPEGEPVIAMSVARIMGGEFSDLHIYEDGTVIYREDKGLRMSTLEHPPTRTWKTGQLEEEELNSLIDFFKSCQFDELDTYYQYPDPSWESGTISDMDCTISISSGDYNKTVRAFGYFPPDSSLPYPKLPYPLNEIYNKLMDIADNRTEVVYQKTIQFTVPRE